MYGQWFEDFYLKLIAYKERNGGFDRVQQDDEIGTLVASVRSGYSGKRKTRLTNEMINKLNAIGFPWVVREKDWFTIFYKKLIDYRDGEIEQNGRIIKPKGSFDLVVRDKEIGVKVNHIRKAYKYKDDPTKKGLMQLTEEIIARLDAIGFPWEVAKEDRYRDWFTPFYEKLTKYKEEKGRFWGVTNDKDIGKIVGSVRTAYKYKDDENKKVSYRLTQEMIDKLNAIGFPWEARAKKIQEDVLSV